MTLWVTQEGETIAALSEIYGVSRKAIHEWLGHYQEAGVAGLAERSRAPHWRPLSAS